MKFQKMPYLNNIFVAFFLYINAHYFPNFCNNALLHYLILKSNALLHFSRKSDAIMKSITAIMHYWKSDLKGLKIAKIVHFWSNLVIKVLLIPGKPLKNRGIFWAWVISDLLFLRNGFRNLCSKFLKKVLIYHTRNYKKNRQKLHIG